MPRPRKPHSFIPEAPELCPLGLTKGSLHGHHWGRHEPLVVSLPPAPGLSVGLRVGSGQIQVSLREACSVCR